jgi:hypothetical protein
MSARMRMEMVITAIRGPGSPTTGYDFASTITNPFDSDASEVTRAIQFIHPVSNPTKSPKAVFAYRYAPPGSLK